MKSSIFLNAVKSCMLVQNMNINMVFTLHKSRGCGYLSTTDHWLIVKVLYHLIRKEREHNFRAKMCHAPRDKVSQEKMKSRPSGTPALTIRPNHTFDFKIQHMCRENIMELLNQLQTHSIYPKRCQLCSIGKSGKKEP